MYGNRPRRWSSELSGAARVRFIINAFTRMRMIYPDGRLNFTYSGPPDKARKGLIPWYAAAKPKWQGTRIVFGHWSTLGYRAEHNIVSLDSGCVWGGSLSAYRLEDGALFQEPGPH